MDSYYLEETKLASHYFKFQSERKRTHIIWWRQNLVSHSFSWITESLELHLVEANRSVVCDHVWPTIGGGNYA